MNAKLDDPYYTPNEVMKILKIHRSMMYELMWTGEIATKRVGRLYRISREDLQAFVERSASAAR